ncbi:hypothetical protein THRCLA_20098, partial [Thraustotheca clavata]
MQRFMLSHAKDLPIAIGLAYILLSLSSSVWYLFILSPSMANDFWWAGYNITGSQAYLVDLVNQILCTHANGSFDPLVSTAHVAKTYTLPVSYTNIIPTYMRAYTLGELQTIEYAVVHLRQLSAYWSMRMNSQYCWVDFNKTFEAAHTISRQLRCEKYYKDNAAVYLEAMLRNQIWDAYVLYWSGIGINFNVAYERGLQETQQGRDFLAQISSSLVRSTIEDEIAYWKSYNLTKYKLQWQNRWQPRISETILVENAFGMQQLITLKALDQVVGPWSSQSLFWMPLQDTFNAMIMNRSFIRGTSLYFGANTTNHLPVINLETYRGIASASGALTGIANLFHNQIGPYLSIDLFLVPVPKILTTVYNQFHHILYDQLTSDTFDTFMSMPSLTGAPVPPIWRNLVYFGGDPMCTSGAVSTFVQQSFDFFETCFQPTQLQLSINNEAMIWSLWLNLQLGQQLSATTISSICANLVSPLPCQANYAQVAALYKSLSFPTELTNKLILLKDAIQSTQVSLMQFVATQPNGSISLLQQQLLDSDEYWNVLGWCFVFEWVLGIREVVSFEGDVSSMVLISNAYVGQQYITSNTTMETATKMIYYLVLITSLLLVGVGLLASVFLVTTRLNVVGANLLKFNRLVGDIWIGRSLTFIRGASAVLLLSSCQVSLTISKGFSRLKHTPRSFIETLIVTGEATWITYTMNDFLVLFFRDISRHYWKWSSSLVWLIYLLIELLYPVEMTISLDRQCVGRDMDFELSCTTGVVYVGSFSRTLLLFGIQGGAIIICMFAWKLYLGLYPHPSGQLAERSFHFSGSTDILAQPIKEDLTTATYDFVTCILCGLIPIHIRSKSYTFDLKIWEFIHDPESTVSEKRFTAPYIGTQTFTKIIPLVPEHEVLPKRTGSRWRQLLAVAGMGHMLFAIFSSISYFEVAQVNLTNDVYWAGFNITGAHAFFATWLNEQLVLGLSSQQLEI